MYKIKEFINKIIGILIGSSLIIFTLYTALSIIFYNENDRSLNTVTNNTIIYNRMGVVGSYLADFFIQIFGFVSILILLIFVKIGYNLIRNKFKRYNVYYKIIMFILFITTSSVLINKFVMKKFIIASSGGFLGIYMNKLLSGIPDIIIIVSFLFINVVSLTIIFDKSFKIWLIDFIKFLRMPKLLIRPLKKILEKNREKYNLMYENQNKKIRELEEYIHNIENKQYNQDNIEGNIINSINYSNEYKEKNCDQNIMNNNNFEQIESSIYNSKENNKKNISSKSNFFNFGNIIKKTASYIIPKTSLLNEHPTNSNQITKEELYNKANELKRVLAEFKINGKVISVKAGPIITLFEFEPSAGIKSSRIIGLSDDVARSLRVKSTRISVIENKNAMGIEIPNRIRDTIYLKEILESNEYKNTKYVLPIILGTSISGDPVIIDLAKAPHLLIAGTTGSGKSVSINTMILSLLYRFTPEECKFIMIDPKMLELSAYEGIPHLLSPVVTNAQKAISSLRWVVSEMENRYRLMSNLGVRNITGFNEKVKKAKKDGTELQISILMGYNEKGEPIYDTKTIETKSMPYIVVVVDEMADLMITAGKDIEALIQRIAQMARAAGIHIIMATQRPSVDVITGVIKANFPSRVSFLVSSKIDSKVIIGEQGAEQLLGYGDMLYSTNGAKLTRAHGPFVSDEEVEEVVKFIKSQGFKPAYVKEILEEEHEDNNGDFEINIGNNNGNDEELYKQAIQIVLRDRKTSISYLQRVLRIGYNKSATIIERMEKDGILSAPNTKGLREIIEE